MFKVWSMDSFWPMNGLLLVGGKISENQHLEAYITTWHWGNIQVLWSPSSKFYPSSHTPVGTIENPPLGTLRATENWNGAEICPHLLPWHHVPFKPCCHRPRRRLLVFGLLVHACPHIQGKHLKALLRSLSSLAATEAMATWGTMYFHSTAIIQQGNEFPVMFS